MSESEHEQDRDERIIEIMMDSPETRGIHLAFEKVARRLGVTTQKLWDLNREAMRRIAEKERDELIIEMMMAPYDPDKPSISIGDCMAEYGISLEKVMELNQEALRRLNDKALPAASDELTANLNSRTQQQISDMINSRPLVEADQTRLP